ncbi:AMP-binding protein [Methylobacterium aquaticum]|uniref:AMP-binding protein n=1 Tax=Methylobacterium aquaticum TaxID=270351 RepID=UPI001934070B|nr:AMP-binding protein [Methylobacterium aquaticum]QRE72403.1 fatty acyl-AMP ligase [Methylobacterium aquaticum]
MNVVTRAPVPAAAWTTRTLEADRPVQTDPAATLLDRLARHARRTPDKPCLIHHQDERYSVLTFADVQALAERVAVTLSRAVAGAPAPQEAPLSRVVLLFLKHHPVQLPAYLGTMMAGLVPSFMAFPTPKQDPVLYWKSHAALIRRIRPAVIVTYPEIAGDLEALCAGFGTKVLLIDELSAGDPGAVPGPLPGPGDTALLQHSSGTTGLKKGVELTFGQIEAQATAYAPAIGLGPDSTVVSWLPYYHDMGLFTAFLIPLTVGAAVVSMDAFAWVGRPASLFELIERFRGTHCWLPNFAFRHLVNTVPREEAGGRRYRLDSMDAFVSCSEPVKSASLRDFAEAFAGFGIRPEQLTACYAMAETGFAVSQSDPLRHEAVRFYAAEPLGTKGRAIAVAPDHPGARALVSNGPPLEGVEVRILAGAAAPGGEGAPVGEIAVRGSIVFSGYYEDPAATAAALADGWYRTGDIGFIDGGELFISGRIKDVIIVHGRNYYAHDIEEVVSAEAGVVPGRAVAVGVANEEVGSEDVVVLAETRTVDEAARKALKRAIKRAIFDRLELTVRSVHLVDPGWLTKTSSGKISRSENLARYRAEHTTARG